MAKQGSLSYSIQQLENIQY